MPKLLMVDLGGAWGGQEVYSRSIMKTLALRGWEITSLSGQSKHADSTYDFIPVPISYSHFPETARRIRDIQNSHDIVHFNGIRAIYLANICKKIRPFIATKHSCYRSPGGFWRRGQFARLASPLVFNKLDWLITVSPQVNRELPGWVRQRSGVILNGVEDVGICPCLAPMSRPFTVCYVGGLFARKGVMRLLRALHILRKSFPEFTLVLAGKGPLEAQAREYVARHGLSEHVRFAGFVESPGEVYRQSRICVLPSVYEGLPLTLLEALSAGCALVGHDIPGVREVISDGENGLLSPISPQGLANTLLKLLTQPILLSAMQQRAREDYDAKWRLERMVQETETVYKRLIQNHLLLIVVAITLVYVLSNFGRNVNAGCLS